MYLNSIRIQNYRGLKKVELPLSCFVCIIGENNSGKSSTLLALNLFLGEGSINKRDFYDKSKPVKIEVEIVDIQEEDLARLEEKHRKKIIPEIKENKLKLVRKYGTDLSNKIYLKKLLPKDNRFDNNEINKVLENQTGSKVQIAIQNHLKEYADLFEGVKSQKRAKEIIKSIIDGMDNDEKIEKETDLPSGIPSSITNLLPKPILISAVKNLTDDAKMKSTTTFGKIITALMGLIEESEVEDINNSLNTLKKLLNRIENDDGTLNDEHRIEPLKRLEKSVTSYLQDNFYNTKVEIDISPPSLDKILSNAVILVDDGIKGNIESKGDGLKRAVIFALLRTYNEMKIHSKRDRRPYLFLFEEPELYLHPAAQKILFEALNTISKADQVVTTTHSPIFFSSDYTGTFIKMKRNLKDKPFSEPSFINIKEDMEKGKLFQIICFENNNAAFFSDKVLLVEGDSDLIFFKNISKTLYEKWDFDVKNIPIIKIQGKGNVGHYKQFFEHFDIEVHAILDLDALVSDFDKICISEDIQAKYRSLKDEITSIAVEKGINKSPETRKEVKKVTRKYTLVDKYKRLKEIVGEVRSSKFLSPEQVREFNDFSASIFRLEKHINEEIILSSYGHELEFKDNLLGALREENIYVLSKGTVEDYYPPGIEIKNKLSRAWRACELLSSRDEIEKVCPIREYEGLEKSEFDVIFTNIFGSPIENVPIVPEIPENKEMLPEKD